MFLTVQVTIAHEGDLLTLHGINAMEHISLVGNLSQHNISDLQLFGTDERDAVAAPLNERTHAHASRRETHLPAFGYKAGNLGDEYLIG